MSATKRFLEFVSREMGFDGEVDDVVTAEAERRLLRLSTPEVGNDVVELTAMADGVVINVLPNEVFTIELDSGAVVNRRRDGFLLNKAMNLHARMSEKEQ